MKKLAISIAMIVAVILAPMTYAEEVTKAQFDQWMKELSNWGRWGKDDQLGALNLITPAKKVAAAKLVSVGKSVSLSRVIPMVSLPESAMANRAPEIKGSAVNVYNINTEQGYFWERYEVEYHGSEVTHLDALCHIAYLGKVYNGIDFVDVASKKSGCTSHGIFSVKGGVLTRGILIDLPGVEVTPKDILAWEAKTGIRIGSGDAVFLRSGRDIKQYEGKQSGGYDPTMIPFFKERDIAILGSDFHQDARMVPEVGLAIHVFTLVGLGVHLFDNLYLEALAATAAELERWEFMFVAAPHVMPQGSGAAINPIAVF